MFLFCCNIQTFEARKADDEVDKYYRSNRWQSVNPGREEGKKESLYVHIQYWRAI